jgi:hypothetical protein
MGQVTEADNRNSWSISAESREEATAYSMVGRFYPQTEREIVFAQKQRTANNVVAEAGMREVTTHLYFYQLL